MTKQLYEVQITLYVVAETDTDAEAIGLRSAQEELHAQVYEATSVDSVWANCRPYQDEPEEFPDYTCLEWLDLVEAREHNEPRGGAENA